MFAFAQEIYYNTIPWFTIATEHLNQLPTKGINSANELHLNKLANPSNKSKHTFVANLSYSIPTARDSVI